MESRPQRAVSRRVASPLQNARSVPSQVPGSRMQVPGFRMQVPGSRFRVPGSASPARMDVAGVSLSHPDRVLFPTVHATKLDLARYYEAISDWSLLHVADRPLTLVRCPTGVSAGGAKRSGECFFMKHSKVWAPGAIRRGRVREKTKG